MENGERELVTTDELCKTLKVTKAAVYKWRQDGCPTVIASGNICRYYLNEVIDWLNSGRNSQ